MSQKLTFSHIYDVLKSLCEDTTSFPKLTKNIDILAFSMKFCVLAGKTSSFLYETSIFFASLLVKYLSVKMMG